MAGRHSRANGNRNTLTKFYNLFSHYVLDPLHIISYEAIRLNVGSAPTSSFVTSKTAHMFKAKASGTASPILIKVTDRFGNIYTETMSMPKDFVLTMR